MSEPTVEHVKDIATIGEVLLDLAQQRGWCAIWEGLVKELNQSLIVKLPEYVPEEKMYDETCIDAREQVVIDQGCAALDYPDLVSTKRDSAKRRAVRQRHAALDRIDLLEAALEISRKARFDDLKAKYGEESIDYLMGIHEEVHAMIQLAGYPLP